MAGEGIAWRANAASPAGCSSEARWRARCSWRWRASPAAAQSVDQDGDRVPGIPEPSIAVNFPRAFGDPGGIRSALAGRGITYAINYIGETLGNPTGGFAQGTFYDGRLEVALTVDMEKAIGWRGPDAVHQCLRDPRAQHHRH